MQPGNNLSLSFIGANRNAERSPDKQNNAIQENEVLACNSCNFVGKNRKSIAVHWVWFPDCKKGEFTKKNAVHVKAEPELKKQASNSALYRCDVCNFETKYSQNLTGHFKSLKHIANAGPEPEIPEDELKNPESDLDGRIKELDLSIADSLSPKYRCETCNFTTKYSSNLTAHFKTQKHISNCEESNEEVIDDYNDFNDDYHCHVCQFKTRFVKSWISHVNSRLHKDAIKQNEDENEDLEEFHGFQDTKSSIEDTVEIHDRSQTSSNMSDFKDLDDDIASPSPGVQISRKTEAFQCNLCTAVFGFKFNVKRHFHKAHPDETYENSNIKNINIE